jgi:hypothetical protein
MNRILRSAMVTLVAFALVGASTAGATTVQKLSLQELAKRSDAIAVAVVEDATARYDANKEIYTYITLRVLDPVKGAHKDETLTIRQIGGTVGSIASVVSGMPTFKKGEEVVVFLSQKDPAGYPWVMGLQQGKYSVSLDDKGQKRVRNELGDLKLMSLDGSVSDGAKVSSDMPLQAFLDGIRTGLDTTGKVQVDPTPQAE